MDVHLFDPIKPLAQSLYTYFFVFTFISARVVPIFTIFPVFAQLNIPRSRLVIIALSLSIPIIVREKSGLELLMQSSLVQISFTLAKEFAIGALIGTLLAAPFWGVQAAGDIIDFSRSASAANLSDPVNASQTSVSGRIMLLLSVALFLASNGLFLILDIVYESYTDWPINLVFPHLSINAVQLAGGILGKLFTVGIIISGPLMIAMFVIDITLVFAVRSAKQFPVYDMSIIIKNLAFAFFFPYYGMLLNEYVKDDWHEAFQFLYQILKP